MTPFELKRLSDADKLTKHAYEIIKPWKIAPKTEKRCRVSGQDTWRFIWDITEEFILKMPFLQTPPTIHDVGKELVYVLDVQSDNCIDYISKEV